MSAAFRAFKEMQLEAAAQLRATTRKDDAVVVKKYEVRPVQCGRGGRRVYLCMYVHVCCSVARLCSCAAVSCAAATRLCVL